MNKISFIFICVLMIPISACTYNISNAQTTGSASDTIEDTATNTPDISPDITVPMSAVPGV